MSEFIIMFLPSVLSTVIYESIANNTKKKEIKYTNEIFNFFKIYFLSVLFNNFFTSIIAYFTTCNNISYCLNNYLDYNIKFSLISIIFSIFTPVIFVIVSKIFKIEVTVKMNEKAKKNNK